jgi:hypothetical protein
MCLSKEKILCLTHEITISLSHNQFVKFIDIWGEFWKVNIALQIFSHQMSAPIPQTISKFLLYPMWYLFHFTVSHSVMVTWCSCVETTLLLWIQHRNKMQPSNSLLQHLSFHYCYVQIFLSLVKRNKEKSNKILCDKFDFWWIDSVTICLQCVRGIGFAAKSMK